MIFNPIACLAATLVTLLIGFIWYNKNVFGTIWMRETGITEEDARKSNMAKVFGFTILFSLMISFSLPGIVIHQVGALQMVGGNEKDEAYMAYMQVHGEAFRTFRHGALHGFMIGLMFVFPILGVNGMFNRSSWKLIFITAGYWIVTLTVMGAIICGWR